MIKNLFWFSWLVFLLSAVAITAGGLILLKTGKNRGIYITYAGFMGLSVSGLLLTIACGVP